MKKGIIKITAVVLVLALTAIFGACTIVINNVPEATDAPAATDKPADPTAQPTAVPDDGTMTGPQVAETFGGVWSQVENADVFLMFSIDGDKVTLEKGSWSTGNVSAVYDLKIKSLDQTEKDFEFALTKDGKTETKNVMMYMAGSTFDLDLGSGKNAYVRDNVQSHDMEAIVKFVKSMQGSWTASDNTFIEFSIEDGNPYVMFAVWNSGGEFPVGKVARLDKIDDTHYTLGLIMKGETKLTNFTLVDKVKDTNSFDLSDEGGKAVNYFYDAAMQLHPVG